MVKKISVAVNSWDCVDGLKLMVESFIDTTSDRYNTELCVALDGAPHESARYMTIMSQDRPIKWSWSTHKGLSRSINQAFKLCSNEYILWVSDDYVFMPGWDDKLRKYLHPDHFVSIQTFEPHNSPFPSREGLDYQALLAYLAATETRLAGELGYVFGNGAFAAEKARSVGGFDPDFVDGSMDGDFIYRMHKAFPELIFFRPKDIGFYHFSSSTRSRHPELKDSCESDGQVFATKHGHSAGSPLYQKIKQHCAGKESVLRSRGIVL